jgi:hypothetical protein
MVDASVAYRRGAKIAVEGLHARKREWISQRRELCLREYLRDVREDRRRFRQYSRIGDQRRHAAFGIDLEVLGFALVSGGEIQPHRFVFGSRFFERDVRRERAGTHGIEKLEHRLPLSSYCDAIVRNAVARPRHRTALHDAPREICEKTAAQYWRPGRRLGDLDWPAQMKLLDETDPSYRT